METVSGRLHGSPTWLDLLDSASYVCSHGITPGVATIVVADDGTGNPLDLTEPGDVDFDDGQTTFTLKNCLPTGAVRASVGDGRGWQISLLDRRWAWKHATISGHYNQRDPWVTTGDRRIVPVTRFGVHDLAEACLRAMGEGEGSWDISALPDPDDDELLPEIHWDVTNAAHALAELCDAFACRVVYQPGADRVLVARAGEGADLPDGTYTRTDPAKMAPNKPGTLRVYGAPAAFAVALVLEATGLDFDGSVTLIQNLSYAPRAGWEAPGTYPLNGLVITPKWQAAGKTIADARLLVRRSVYSWYRVTLAPLTDKADFKIPGLDQFSDSLGGAVQLIDRDQLVPLDRIFGADRDEERHLYVSPASVYGSFSQLLIPRNWGPETKVATGFAIDSDRGLVMFDRPLSRPNLGPLPLGPEFGAPADKAAAKVPRGGLAPAALVLHCSVQVLDLKTRQPLRYYRDRQIDGGSDGVIAAVVRPDIQFASFAEYHPAQKKLLPAKDNRAECDQAADTYLELLARDFEDREQETRTYPRLVQVDPDGAIQQVEWQCGGAVSTRVSRNTEHVTWVPTYLFRRGQEKARLVQQTIGALGGLGGAFNAPLANAGGAARSVLPAPTR